MERVLLSKLKKAEGFYLPGVPGKLLEKFSLFKKEDGMVIVFSEISGQMYFLPADTNVLIKKED